MHAQTRTAIIALALVASVPSLSAAQAPSLTTEADLTAGYSTEDAARAAAVQIRLFGSANKRVRFNVEGTWADRSHVYSDVFGAAYPYSGRVQLSEAYAERTFSHGEISTTVRAGQYRSPFGISSRSDYAYSGLLRAPLMRYDGYWAVTNNFLERGVNVVAGIPRLSVEASLGTPGDIGVAERRAGLSSVIRVQASYGDLTVGASHMRSQSYMPLAPDLGRLDFSSVDGRWMRGGVQVRGEWLVGQPANGSATRGGFLDASVHRPRMGPVTAVVRAERLTYTSATPFMWMEMLCDEPWVGARVTVGGRIRLPGGLTAQLALVREGHELAEYTARTAFDFGLTYSIRRH